MQVSHPHKSVIRFTPLPSPLQLLLLLNNAMGMSKHFNSVTKFRYKVLAVVTEENFFFVATLPCKFLPTFQGPCCSHHQMQMNNPSKESTTLVSIRIHIQEDNYLQQQYVYRVLINP